jgi:hypothetical protein
MCSNLLRSYDGDRRECGAMVECYRKWEGGGTQVIVGKPVPLPRFPTHISHGSNWDRPRSSGVLILDLLSTPIHGDVIRSGIAYCSRNRTRLYVIISLARVFVTCSELEQVAHWDEDERMRRQASDLLAEGFRFRLSS